MLRLHITSDEHNTQFIEFLQTVQPNSQLSEFDIPLYIPLF